MAVYMLAATVTLEFCEVFVQLLYWSTEYVPLAFIPVSVLFVLLTPPAEVPVGTTVTISVVVAVVVEVCVCVDFSYVSTKAESSMSMERAFGDRISPATTTSGTSVTAFAKILVMAFEVKFYGACKFLFVT